MSFRKKCGSSCGVALIQTCFPSMELQYAGEEDIAKEVKRARKQGLVEGNVRWLRKAACASQSSEISSHLISLSIDLLSHAGVSWWAVGGGHLLAPVFWVGFGTRKPHASKSQKRLLSRCAKASCLWGLGKERGETASRGKGRRRGSANEARCPASWCVASSGMRRCWHAGTGGQSGS